MSTEDRFVHGKQGDFNKQSTFGSNMTPLPPDVPALIENWFLERNLDLPYDLIRKIEIYYDLILCWSARMNLVSKGDLGNLLERHMLDSLVPLPEIPEHGSLADIGSGAGFPAIPLALVRRDLQITLIEARHKKILFLKETCRRLDLRSIDLIETRLEEFRPDAPFDMVTMRALPGWESRVTHIRRILKPSGKLIYYERPGKCRIIREL
jgi:16S rRNA (guanine527-N7)-methyltransferase